MRNKITKTSLIPVLMLAAAFLFGNSVFTEAVTNVTINITLNGASDEDYVEYYLRGIQERKITSNISLRILSGRNIKFVAHGKFLNWSGSTCGDGSGNILEFESSSDCDVVANFGTATRRR